MTTEVVTLFEEQTLSLASGIMKLRKIRHLPVVDDGYCLVGLVTHRDLLRAQGELMLYLKDSDSEVGSEISIKKIMTRDVWTVKPETEIGDAGRLLADHSFSCLPVTDHAGVLVGILTDRDYLNLALDWIEGEEPATNPGR